MKHPYRLIVLLIAMIFPPASHAAMVTFDYTGTITGKMFLSSDLQTLIPVGQRFSGSYTFDSDASPHSMANPNDMSYTGAIRNFSVNFGSLYANLDNGALRLQNGYSGTPKDTFIVQGRTDHAALPTRVNTNIVLSDYTSPTITSGWHVRWLRMEFTDATGNMLSNSLLSATPPDITGVRTRFEFGFKLDCCSGQSDVYGAIDSLTVRPIPSPSVFLLLSTGFVSFIAMRRRFRTR